jgi:DNA-binding NtrC family response regulator
LRSYADKHGRKTSGFSSKALETLTNYDFPGNVRELANAVERACIVASNARIENEDLPESLRTAVAMKEKTARRLTLAEIEEEYVKETLRFTKGNKSEAARLLGISRKNLYEKLERYRKGDS